MNGLVQDDDFNAEVVVRFLHQNGVDATTDATGGFRYAAANATRASHVRFACVCLRVDKLCDRGRLLLHEGEAMMLRLMPHQVP